MKNVSRNKFLICFRPVVDMDSMQLQSNSEAVVVDRSENRQALTYFGVKNKENTESSTTTKAPGVSISDTKNSIMVRRPGKKTFSKVIKAVVFEIMLAKRVRDRKGIEQESCSSKHDFQLSNPDKSLDSSFHKIVLAGKGIQDTISPSKSSCSSSSSLSSPSPSSSSSTSNSTQKAKIRHPQSNCNTCRNHQESEMKPKLEGIDKGSSSGSSSNMAIFLLLIISLAVTIFWGKFSAILFTSTWLYFFPHRQPTEVNGNLETIKRSSEKIQEITKRRS